jgi:hypothetical protein
MGKPNDVTAVHTDYAHALPDWELVEDVTDGERAVKAKGDLYLPRPNPHDKSMENGQRFEQYVKRAVFYNATGRTLSGLIGLAFRKAPSVTLPSSIAGLADDVTGSGIKLLQLAKEVVTEVLECGRAGLLVDFPKTEGAISQADIAQQGLTPTITLYEARSITNWRTARVGSKQMLILVVLKETHDIDDGFSMVTENQYRVLRLANGIYSVEIWREQINSDGQKVWVIVEETFPVQGNGRPWSEIPFAFVGSEDNDADIDGSPLLDLATLNVAHYRNSADYEDSVYMVGQPQPWMSGLDIEWRDSLISKGIYIGARTVIPLPIGGSFGIAQTSPNTLVKEAMDQKELQMAAMGARLIQSGGAIKTATQQDSEDAIAHSVLSLACDNSSEALEKALTWAVQYSTGATDAVEFEIPTEFAAMPLDSTMLAQLLALVQAGKMPDADLFSALRNAGLIDPEKDDEQIREEISSQPVTGMAAALSLGAAPPPEQNPAGE